MAEKKKRSTEIAIQIQENEAIYNQQVEESKRIIDLQKKEYEYQVLQSIKAENKLGETKTEQIIKCGKLALKGKVVEKEKISAKLTADFKDYIESSTIRKVCSPLGWTYSSKAAKNNVRSRTTTSENILASVSVPETLSLTPQEKQYVEAHEREIITDKTIEKLVFEWTNKNTADQGRILDKVPKGTHWSKTLAEESTNYMREVAYKMTTSALHRRLEDVRIIKNVADKFGDILYEVYEQRKKTESLGSV